MQNRALPPMAVYQSTLAQTLLQAGRLEEAAVALQRAAEAAPEAFEPRAKLGRLLLQLGRAHQAMAAFEQAVALDPHLQAVCRDTSGLLTEDARCNTVLENCAHILARYPHYAPAHYGKACALLSLGQVEEARRASEHALVIDATVPTYYHVIIHTGDPARNAPALAALEQLAAQEAALDDQDRSTLHFLLAKAYEDSSRFAEAFAHLTEANATKRSMFVYDEAREHAQLQAIAATIGAPQIKAFGGAGHDSPLPVFVVGMLRSGTTLVEQILASHPKVHGAGELNSLPDLIQEGAAGKNFPADFASIAAEQLHALGTRYVEKLAATAPEAKRIVDKQPTNFRYAGLIHLALPQARIIHVRRDPLDTCFSCYALSFAGDVGYAYELGELGRYYRAYERLMAHWRNVLPQGAMLEVQYEALVRDLPNEAKRIVASCGLDWDECCLEFHKTKRAVATASVNQVRQPVYQRAIGRAEPYREFLAPLREALGLR